MKFLHKKSLGQNFLNNPRVPKAMADAALIREGDVVLEVGPGTGALTKELLGRGTKVYAIETDVRAVKILQETFSGEIQSGQLNLLHTDVKELNLAKLGLKPGLFKVVANIPYFLSGYLFRLFLDSAIQPSTLVFLVQKEVAERIARDKKESLLSLSVKVFGEPEYVQTIKKGNFTPQPKVDSAIVAVKNIGKERLHGVSSDFFFGVIHEGFKAKRKQLLGNLSKKFDRDTLSHIFSTLKIPLDVRAEDVSLKKWLELCQKIESDT